MTIFADITDRLHLRARLKQWIMQGWPRFDVSENTIFCFGNIPDRKFLIRRRTIRIRGRHVVRIFLHCIEPLYHVLWLRRWRDGMILILSSFCQMCCGLEKHPESMRVRVGQWVLFQLPTIYGHDRPCASRRKRTEHQPV